MHFISIIITSATPQIIRHYTPEVGEKVKVKVAQPVPDSLRPHGLYSPWNSLGQNIGVGSLSRLQGIFPTQGSNSGLPNYRQILYQLSYKESRGWGPLFKTMHDNQILALIDRKRHC